MVEDLRVSSQQSGPEELSISSGVQAVSSDDAVPIQLIWEQSSEAGAVDTVGTYTKFTKIPPPRPRPDSGMSRGTLVQDSCRRTIHSLSGGRIP
jgi:hypothetical protein